MPIKKKKTGSVHYVTNRYTLEMGSTVDNRSS